MTSRQKQRDLKNLVIDHHHLRNELLVISQVNHKVTSYTKEKRMEAHDLVSLAVHASAMMMKLTYCPSLAYAPLHALRYNRVLR